MLDGILLALNPFNIALAAVGALTGTVVGMLPGIGPINAIAILVPLSLAIDFPPSSVLILMTAIYYGSQYGNSISTILLNVPGTASAVVTAIDGYALTQKGKSEAALAMSAIASFWGGTLSIVGFVVLTPTLSLFAIRFGPAEYVALMFLALSLVSSLSGGSILKASIATLLGLSLSTVGFDPHSAVPRYTFGVLRLLDGLDFVVLTLGLFAVSEILVALDKQSYKNKITSNLRAKLNHWYMYADTMFRGTVIGFFVGLLPGAGGTVASFAAYAIEKKRYPNIGRGELRGVAAPESANNAASTGAMIPLLTMGVPGSGTTAVLLGSLLAIGIEPGPRFLNENPDVFWALGASMVVGNAALLALNLPLVSMFARIILMPRWLLNPLIVVLSTVAVYSVNGSTFDIFIMVLIGISGYILRRCGFPLAPVVLGFVLGGLMERSLRRAMAISDGGWEILISSNLSIGIWSLALLGFIVPVVLRQYRG